MRPSWDDYFIEIAKLVASRATCPRLHVGCVLVSNKRIVATGYNGSAPGTPHCEDVGCLIVDNHCKRTNHAEFNACVELRQKAPNEITAYVTHTPCPICYVTLETFGVTRFVVAESYP